MKKVWMVWLALCLVGSLSGQTNRTIKELQTQRGALQKEIASSEELLLSTKKDVRSQLNDLNLITGQINARKQLIANIERDIKTLESELEDLQKQVTVLERQLDDCKQRYATSMRYMYKKRSIQEKLMFIFSADDLVQTYRRLRYVREYGKFQRVQAEEIVKKRTEIEAKQRELEEVRTEKENLLGERIIEQTKLMEQEKQQRTLVNDLQKKQRSLQQEINRKRREAEKLNAEIDRLIEQELEEVRKRTQAEETKKSADEKQDTKTDESTKTTPVDVYKIDNEDRKLSSSFERNRGILPVPITGPYVIVSRYGTHEVAGLKNVKLDNKGIDIKGKEGAQARAIFSGEVSAVFQYGDMTNVLVRHGNYISVYCNLSSVAVKKGQRLETRDVIGAVAKDASGNYILHFQLRRETTKLNPESWIKR